MQPVDRDDLQLPLRAPQSCYPLRVNTRAPLSDEGLYQLCVANPDLAIERTAQGELIVISPTGGEMARRNFALAVAFGAWIEADGTGVGFDSSGGFLLPNGAERAPDLSWVLKSRWDALTASQRERFPPLCPDFVLELKSPSDALGELRDKMAEYIANGARLGWLLDPESRRVWIFEPGSEPKCLDDPQTVAGDPVLRGFALRLHRVW